MNFLFYALLIGLAIIAYLAFSTSHRKMQALSMVHALSYLAPAAYLLLYVDLPVYYLGNRYLFIDHLCLYEVLIATTVFFFAAMYSWGYVEGLVRAGELNRRDINVFYLMFNALLIVTVLSFMSNNLALFWIFAELTTVASALLVAILNSKKNIDAALEYILITSTLMLFSFIGLMFLFELSKQASTAGTLNWDELMAIAKSLPPTPLVFSFIFVFIGFASKAGIAPFHTWLPHAHSKAPSAVSAILSGVVLNIGLYGILRAYAIVRQTGAEQTISYILIAFGVLTVFVAAFTMLHQKNLKKIMAFSSVENMGLMLAGIGIGTHAAVFWVLYHKLAHSLTKALLFFSAGVLHRQYLSNRADRMQYVFRLQPLAALGLIIGAAAISGMPPFPMFISKISILIQALSFSVPLLLALLLLVLMASASLVVFLIRLFSNKDEGRAHMERYDTQPGMEAPIIALIIILFAIGIFFPDGLRSMLDTITTELGFIGAKP